MTWKTSGLAVALGLSLAGSAWAAPPKIDAIAPLSARRGVATELTISGGNLGGHPRLVASFAFSTADPAPNSDAGHFRLKLVVDPETALGVYPVRVRTDDGLSNPFLLSVGQLPSVAEKEPNSTFETAQVVPPLAVVEGQVAGNDVDFFRFPGKKGQKVVIDARCARIGSGVDPSIRLTTAGRKYVASADDAPGLINDARLWAVLPEDTDYLVELSDSRYQGGNRPVYLLLIGAVPMAEEIYPIGGRQGETVGLELRGGTLPGVRVTAATVRSPDASDVFHVRADNHTLGLAAPGDPVLDVESLAPMAVSRLPELREAADPDASPTRAAPPVVFNGRIDPAGDEDRFALAVTPGQKLHIEVDASENGSALDGVLQVLGAKDAVLATADDTTTTPTNRKGNRAAGIVSPDPSLDVTVPSGLNEIALKLRDLGRRGGTGFAYRITVTPITPTFQVALNDAQISVPKGGTAAVLVNVTRKGYNGPVALKVVNPPKGLSVRPGTIAEGQTLGAFSVSAAPDASFGAVTLRVVGEGQGGDGPITVEAEKAIVFAQVAGSPPQQQVILPTNTVTQVGLAAAPALPTAVTLDAPAEPVEVVHGYGAPVPLKVRRADGADGALTVSPITLPPNAAQLPAGVTVPNANIAAKAAEGTVTVNAAAEAPLGTMTIALLAKGKVKNADQTFAVPAVTLNVVRPAALELAAKSAEVKAGTTFELKGKVVRKGPFKEPVTVRVNGLPAGLKADPVTVAPDASEFAAKIVADPKAAAGTATVNVVVALQVNKKDYAIPPTPLAVKVVPAQ